MASDASQASPGPLVLRIKLRYPDLDTFVEKFAINVGRAGLFLPTRGLQPVGTELRFELRLVDDQVVLSGVGRVVAVHEPRDDDPAAPYGMAIEFMRATRESRDVVLRMLEHRRAMGLGEPALPLPELPAGSGAPAAAVPGGMEGGGARAAGAAGGAEGAAPAAPPIAPRTMTRPRLLGAERPRAPRPSALELVAQLTAQAPGEVAPATPVTWDALVDEPVDLQRALQRARAIASGTTAEELTELGLAAPAQVAAEPGERAARAGGLRAATPAAASSYSSSSSSPSSARAAATSRAVSQPARASDERTMPDGGSGGSAPPLAPARTVTQPRERLSILPRRSDGGEPPASSPAAASPSPQHLPTPRPGAPSTLAATAAARAEAAAAAASTRPTAETAAAARPTAETAARPTDETAGGEVEPEPRRRRVSRPQRLTRPPGVFARGRADREARADDPVDESATATEAEPAGGAGEPPRHPASVEPAAAPALEAATVEAATVETATAEAATAEAAPVEATAGGYSLETTPAFERVLAELEESELSERPAPTSSASSASSSSSSPVHAVSPSSLAASRTASVPTSLPRTITAPMSPLTRLGQPPSYDPLDQLALDDLDDAEPPTGRGGPHAAPWHATLDETVPTEAVELDDSGFEILAESELSAELIEGHGGHSSRADFGGATLLPREDFTLPRTEPLPHEELDLPRGAGAAGPSAPAAARRDDGQPEPTTARSALAAAVSRPTWTRSTALDAAEPTPAPSNELSPPTIPGRVPTREIDLESALDALDIESEVPVAPLRPRSRPIDDDDDLPIELEFDD